MGYPRRLFRLFYVFYKQTSIQFYIKLMRKMSIQYTALGFEPMTFKTWVSSHNQRPGLPPEKFLLCEPQF